MSRLKLDADFDVDLVIHPTTHAFFGRTEATSLHILEADIELDHAANASYIVS